MKRPQQAPTARESSAQLDALTAYRHQWWLHSEHGAPILVANFGAQGALRVDLNIALPSGKHITSSPILVSDIYDYLCAQAVVEPSERPRDEKTLKEHFIRALRVLDYLILNDEFGELADFGLAAVTTQKLNQFLLDVARHKETSESIYAFSSRLRKFLLAEASSIKDNEVAAILRKRRLPLGDIDAPEDSWRLTKNRAELLRVRAYLLREGMYKPTASDRAASKLVPSSSALARRVFRDTLYGSSLRMSIQDTYPELCVGPNLRYQRERTAVVVWSGRTDPRAGIARLQAFVSKIRDFRRLADLGVGIPSEVIDSVTDIQAALGSGSLKPIDGVLPAPPQAVVRAVYAGVELFYDHGEHLLASATEVILAARGANLRPGELASECFNELLLPETRAFGVTCWGLHSALYASRSTWPSSAEYLCALRGNTKGLWDMVACLFGAMLIVVGLTQAARQGELTDLTAGDIAKSKWLRYLTRKSESAHARRQDYRPVPVVSEEMLKCLASFQTDVGSPGLPLFSYPALGGELRRATSNTCYVAIDRFLDYIDGECAPNGHRYYLRQHQLRGFFSEAFFYCFSFAGLSTLQWFLRHLDPEHVWAYIEHTTPGTVLRRHTSAAAASLIRSGSHDLDALVRMVRKKFGARSLELMEQEELAELIEDLQQQGLVSIRPVFGKVAGKADFSTMRLGALIKGV